MSLLNVSILILLDMFNGHIIDSQMIITTSPENTDFGSLKLYFVLHTLYLPSTKRKCVCDTNPCLFLFA